jgi:DNA-binding FadR family transcriptional regulator
LVDLMEARNLMEVTSARLAAEQRDADGMERLRTVMKALESLRHEESNAAFLTVSRDFHDVVNSMSGNPAIDLVSSSFVHMVLDRMTGFAYPAARRAELTSQHIAIAVAILKGNASAAERLMRDHMQAYADNAWREWNTDARFETVSWS